MEEKRFSYCVHGFMHRLGLRASELQVYAVLYSYTVGRVGIYYGSKEHLAESVGYTPRTVYRSLKRLSELGLIESVTYKGRYAIRCTELCEEKGESAATQADTRAAIESREESGNSAISSPEGREIHAPTSCTELSHAAGKNGISAEPCDEKSDTGRLATRRESLEFVRKLKKSNPSLRMRLASVGSSLAARDKYDAASDGERGRIVYNLLLDMYEEERSAPGEKPKYDIYNPKYVLLRFGSDDLVELTKEQYYSLCSIAPSEVVEVYINRLAGVIKKSLKAGLDYSIHSHYRVIRRWLEEDLGSGGHILA